MEYLIPHPIRQNIQLKILNKRGYYYTPIWV